MERVGFTSKKIKTIFAVAIAAIVVAGFSGVSAVPAQAASYATPCSYSSSLASPTVVSVTKSYKNNKPSNYKIKLKNNNAKKCYICVGEYCKKPSAYSSYCNGDTYVFSSKQTRTITYYTNVWKGASRTIYASSFYRSGKQNLYSKVSAGKTVKW